MVDYLMTHHSNAPNPNHNPNPNPNPSPSPDTKPNPIPNHDPNPNLNHSPNPSPNPNPAGAHERAQIATTTLLHSLAYGHSSVRESPLSRVE